MGRYRCQRKRGGSIDICLEAGLNLFDTADVYSDGASESILGAAIAGRRDQVLISTKVTLRAGTGPNDVGASRHHLLRAVDLALKRLKTDYIDLLQLHHFDAMTPVESVMSTLDDLVRAGKVRYVGVSNFSGWQLMKSLAVADRYGYARYVANQTYYSLHRPRLRVGADAARTRSRYRRGRVESARLGTLDRPHPSRSSATSRRARLAETAQFAPPRTMSACIESSMRSRRVAQETGKTIPQIAINWLLQRPTVSTVLIGARNEAAAARQSRRGRLDADGGTQSPHSILRAR